ncbi:ATP-binding protein [Pannonibacter phragmitetus]|uniref:ATP-binding protein n=1 Tax=Pannonibacter phragmitetus TaxID=121719 RepID=UPI000E66B9FA|nr:ATP-binding protein [Pannonibacter phragmitetus]
MGRLETIKVIRRFQRSIRIDADLGDAEALEGFVCPQSSADVLLNMARHADKTGHTAFTWTGPYGSGKSSLVIALSALLGGDDKLHKLAVQTLGSSVTEELLNAFPRGAAGWSIVPVVGRRDDPAEVLGEALEAAGLLGNSRRTPWTGTALLKTLERTLEKHNLVLFIDEMGKFLEGAARRGSDIFLFQELAELASRSRGRLVLVGILHQAFDEYAHRLSREMRDEWSKIQGRFVDLPVNMAGEEQIELLSRAIDSDHKPKRPGPAASAIANEIRRNRPSVSSQLALWLEHCWPLHPIVSCMLGPISRRRFGQNQRSVFGFLNSAEAFGFQEFLNARREAHFSPDRLWDYLRANLEPSILASPDGHRWSIAVEAVERCEAIGGEPIHTEVLKTIALIDLFKDRSGLQPSEPVLCAAFPERSRKEIAETLGQLGAWSLIVFRKFSDSYAIFAGSDFDIDQAVRSALDVLAEIDFSVLQRLAGIQPILAKRHYHATGAMRWFDVRFCPVSSASEVVAEYRPANGTIGLFLLAIPTEGESEDFAGRLCRDAARGSNGCDVVVGLSHRGWVITDLARELLALEQVRDLRPELAGDAVARREIQGRIAALQGQLETELQGALDNATWYQKNFQPKKWLHAELNGLASRLADRRFPEVPRLHNELLNRSKPSSNAIAAQNVLLRAMVLNEGKPRLGIEGFPAEGGLFASLLEATGLYADLGQGWQFVAGDRVDDDRHRLAPVWKAARDYLSANADRAVGLSEIYSVWRQPPFGMKDGLMPVLAVAFILSCRETVAFYRQGIFQARFRDLDTEYLARDPNDIQLRWMDLSDFSRRMLSDMADVVRELDQSNKLTNLTPIDVARGLIAIFETLHPWVKRTNRLSANAAHIRSLFKYANDPNKLLFDDIPAALNAEGKDIGDDTLHPLIADFRGGLAELLDAYPTMLRRCKDVMLSELQVPIASPQALQELRNRAENVKQLAGDFQLDAFIGRIERFKGSEEDVEGILSLAANKPLRDWVDPDVDRAMLNVADLSQRFLRAETFARVKGRADKRHAMAVVVGRAGLPTPLHSEFEVGDAEAKDVEQLAEHLEDVLARESSGLRKAVILAALAEVSASIMQDSEPKRTNGHKKKTKVAS